MTFDDELKIEELFYKGLKTSEIHEQYKYPLKDVKDVRSKWLLDTGNERDLKIRRARLAKEKMNEIRENK